MTRTAGLLLAALALLLCGWVLPPDRVLEEIVRTRERQAPLRVEALLESAQAVPAIRVRIELHSRLGVRIEADDGSRWLIHEGRLTQRGPSSSHPGWMPEPELLVLSTRAALSAWLRDAGVNLAANELARCGDSDCYVLGGRAGQAQVWVEKDHFEVWRLREEQGRTLEYGRYRDWDGVRFPEQIRIDDAQGPVARLSIERVAPAPELERADFTAHWLEATE